MYKQGALALPETVSQNILLTLGRLQKIKGATQADNGWKYT